MVVCDDYRGYMEVELSEDELNALYNGCLENEFGCLRNQYLVVSNDENAGLLRYDGSSFEKVGYKIINNRFLGKVKARNIQQRMAIDMLYNDDITIKVIAGKFGAGKDFLMCAAAIDMIERNKYDKIVYVRNNIEVKNSKPIGHLPGTYNEKMLPYAMNLADHLGGIDGLNLMINHGRIEIAHLGFIRGRDIKNSIIICSEAENMTKEHIQLLIGRVGEGSALWLNGDFKQYDAEVFRENNGLLAAVDKLKGHPRFGYVKLMKTERSETAAMADLLD